MIKNFLQELRTQRWDDHRFYHHSRINQSLHFVSALSFLFAYVMLFFDPVVSALVGWLFGLFKPWVTMGDFTRQVAKIWLVVGIGGLLFRTIHLFFIRDIETGLVWMTKIVTDPFHDLKLYHKAPLFLMKGELIDPGLEKHVRHA